MRKGHSNNEKGSFFFFFFQGGKTDSQVSQVMWSQRSSLLLVFLLRIVVCARSEIVGVLEESNSVVRSELMHPKIPELKVKGTYMQLLFFS